MGIEPISERRQAAASQDAQRTVWVLVLERFHELQCARGLRQVDLSRRLGVSRAQIHGWLSDPENMTLKAAGRLLAAMDARLTCTLDAPEAASKPRAGALRGMLSAIYAPVLFLTNGLI